MLDKTSRRIIECLQRDATLSVQQLAEAVGLSVSTLQRRFRATVGHSVHEESIRHRLRNAMRLLSETDLSILAVAHRAGFGHQEYLGRVFKSRLAITPAEYRKSALSRSVETLNQFRGQPPTRQHD